MTLVIYLTAHSRPVMTFEVEPKVDMPKLLSHLELLEGDNPAEDPNEVKSTPVFTELVRNHTSSLAPKPFSQYGLLGGDSTKMSSHMYTDSLMSPEHDPRVYQNVTAPSSIFICGSQGSGKSHTLSCLLENCLLRSDANVLPRPLTGLVFHYDYFTSDAGGSPCEAAYLSSHPEVKVRVLCPPTNIVQIRRIYSKLPNVHVEGLRIDEADLNTKRMLDLMAVSSIHGSGMPLYLHVVTRILRQLRVSQQNANASFNYAAFKNSLEAEDLTPGQWCPLQQRLDTLESFMASEQVFTGPGKKKRAAAMGRRGSDWAPKPGQLTIIDLSCPCVTAEAACALFNICLSLFLEQTSVVGRVVALDEAHKYMTDSAECDTLTKALLTTIRLQRHQGARVIISTQEPTISPKLLDLCSVTIVHRFTSPDWLRALKSHLAGATVLNQGYGVAKHEDGSLMHPDIGMELFSQIVGLRTGEALLFAPSAVVGVRRFAHESVSTETSSSEVKSEDSHATAVDHDDGSEKAIAISELVRLGHGVMKIRIRKRITQDGGRSVMAG
ncbi:P-loop containing nucleoside triphosphate hydrolase [Purpureocillium lavendulum]|uniref:P-loop containing nucleoside triphosphate hydrolase n=1 Tax=Purpureocillium lavendulum TaxID=1247861 RepID=A0AB34FWQ0_9HYPO|nr:P-loop containing nucleoside triphosphate hydrolase [Purpureocillium lavendulum]